MSPLKFIVCWLVVSIVAFGMTSAQRSDRVQQSLDTGKLIGCLIFGLFVAVASR